MLRFIKQTGIYLFLSFSIAACAPSGQDSAPLSKNEPTSHIKAVYPQTTFAVLSDLHLHASSLGTSGSAFQAYQDNDRKMLKESEELFDAAIDQIAATSADFVLVSGDLTKDGEALNHRVAARKLKRLTEAGKKVLVTPGNHDIHNFVASSYQGAETVAVATVSADEFADIYSGFGFQSALYRDAHSLSYIAEPVDGLWVLALDSCRYREQEPGDHPITAGAISEATIEWMEQMLARAGKEQKAVIAFLHHGILEHYPGNEKYYSQYLVDDHEDIAERLSLHGVVLVFSGHFHAQDITGMQFENPPRIIYDIETGSTVTAPCPYRLVTISADQQAVIQSRFITAIPSYQKDFDKFSLSSVTTGTERLADKALQKYGVSKEDRDLFNPQIAKAYVAHLQGDESRPDTIIDKTGAGLWARFVIFMQEGLIDGWYTDLPPADNEISIDLISGKTME